MEEEEEKEELKKPLFPMSIDSEFNNLSLESTSASDDTEMAQLSFATTITHSPVIKSEFATYRLKHELEIIKEDPFTHCSCGPEGDDILKWQAAIMGPPDTPIEDGIYFLSIDIPENYPFSPPKIKFQTKIFHPSIDEDGNIYVDILEEDGWTPAMSIMSSLISIWSILPDPSILDPSGPLADLDSVERKNFDKKAREWAFKYAMV
ncbi:ubiquitin-conjugating enzyme E2 D1-like [Macadamia integrifolia]|uniref:ubiquitin-conjugating enzyme E2 D1-like n=1 Tax=Macadamia integrifolia TaxID=60698 RepID=UPI001C4E520D|nr:ubiquitin-conjugating enzyme E2 D1-like [Macadamia integrifolia]